MDHSPVSIDPSGQKSCILIVGRHNHAKSLVGAEIICQHQRYTGATPRVGREGYCISLEFGDISNTGIFDAP
jgi:hypothetical protein